MFFYLGRFGPMSVELKIGFVKEEYSDSCPIWLAAWFIILDGSR